MGKNQIRLLAMFLFVMVLAACSDKETEPKLVDVDLSVSPEQAEVGEMVTIEAKVTYGDEVVTDADEVSFEIWRAHDEDHEKIEIEHAGEGNYRLERAFEQEGTYYVISHVTARDMHNMPKKEFVIGEPSEPEESPSSSHMDHGDSEEDHSGEH